MKGEAILDEEELRLRIRQLSAAETRTLLIVRALTCFYSAVDGVCSQYPRVVDWCSARFCGVRQGGEFSLVLALLAGSLGVLAMIAGAIMLARETRFSFQVLREERNFLTERVHERIAKLTGTLTQVGQDHY